MEWKKLMKRNKLMVLFIVITLLLQSSVLIASDAADSTLVGQWNFEESEGTNTIAFDSSVNCNDGTINGATWVDGRIGDALSFDGNDYVEIPYISELNPRTAITVEAWVNPSSNTNWQRVISKSAYPNTDYSLFRGDKNNIGFSVKIGSVNRTAYSVANTVPIGVWTYVVGTYDGSRVRLYINGKQVTSIAVTGQINAHQEALRIGGDPKGDYFKGKIDEVSIFNRALTATEILRRYQAAPQPAAPKVVEIATSKDGAKVFLTFDKEMATPPATPAGFTVSAIENKPIQAVQLNANKAIIELTLGARIIVNENVIVSYTAGAVKAADGGSLADFTDTNVINNSTAPFVGTWHFNEGEGTLAEDQSCNGNNGIIEGATWVSGMIEGALSFDGNDYVEIPHDEILNPRNALSIDVFVKPDCNKVWQRIVSKSSYPNTDYSIFRGDKNNVGFSIKIGEVNRTVYSAANTVPIGVWTNVAGTYDGTRMRLYINGVQVNSIAVTGLINAHAQALRIGGDPKGDYFQGMIDEVEIFSEALLPEVIRDRYEAAINYGKLLDGNGNPM